MHYKFELIDITILHKMINHMEIKTTVLYDKFKYANIDKTVKFGQCKCC